MLVVVLIVAVVNLVLLVKKGGREARDGLSTEKLEELALKLEKHHLQAPAARAWIDYLEAARPGRSERAQIWYRVGKIYQDEGEYERALEAYYRSESFAKLDEIETEISRRAAECLENLGKFAALGFELEKRTSFAPDDSTGGSAIVAEIGSWKISRVELDMMIESEIDVQLSRLAGGLSSDEKKAQKEMLLENVLKQGGRVAWLERFIAEELLYRRAREEGLYEDPEVRSITRSVERNVLAQKLLEKKFYSGIAVTPEELRSYYDTHSSEFEENGSQKPFDEVRDQIYATVRMQKEMEVQKRVLEELMDSYDVVIHRSKLSS